ncbi:MAG: nucleoside monophosphate kinase [Chlamydiia bacterium]
MLKMLSQRAAILACLYSSVILYAFEPVIILVGPPGSGKGTFSQHMKDRYGYSHICIGDLLRYEIKQRTLLGIEIEETVRNGRYVDPKIVEALLEKAISQCRMDRSSCILDGFGQNEGELDTIRHLLHEQGLLDRTFLLYLNSPDDMCEARILNRSVCSDCGHVYNGVAAQPILDGVCDHCSHPLSTKINDTPGVVVNRLRHYRDRVQRYYEASLSVFPSLTFDSSGPLEECQLFYDRLAREVDTDSDAISFVLRMTGRPLL